MWITINWKILKEMGPCKIYYRWIGCVVGKLFYRKYSDRIYWFLQNKKLLTPGISLSLRSFLSCGRWDLNPHERIAHKILSLARLPVPTLPHIAFLLLKFNFHSRQLVLYQKFFIMSTLFQNFFQKNFPTSKFPWKTTQISCALFLVFFPNLLYFSA